MGFFCGTLDGHGDPTVVWAVGELDLAVAARLGAEIEPHLLPGSTVVLDCAGITFMDSLGLEVLIHAARTADLAKAEFMLVTVPQPVRRVLHLSGLSSDFTVFDNLAQATNRASDAGNGV
jgi:anti-anti-sigma factor